MNIRQARSRSATVMLVNLRAIEYPVLSAPLALMTLGGVLRAACGTLKHLVYFDRQLEDWGSLRDRLAALRPDVVGISAQFGTEADLAMALKIVSRSSPRSTVCVGNVTATYGADQLTKTWPTVVFCLGRGEETLVTIVDNIGRGGAWDRPEIVPNVACPSVGGERRWPEARPTPARLIHPADWTGFFEQYDHRRYDEVWIEASRGCPQKRNGTGCVYCAILPKAGSRDWSPRPLEVVMGDLRELARLGVPHVRFADEEFMAHQPEHGIEFAVHAARLRTELRASGFTLPSFDIAMRVDDVVRQNPAQDRVRTMLIGDKALKASPNERRRDSLRALGSIGLRQVYLGVESGSASQLRRMRKGVTPYGNALALKVLRSLHLQAACGWIMFDPYMPSAAEVLENCAFLEANRLIPARALDDFVTNPINRMRVLAGTPLLDEVRASGLLGSRQSNLVEYSFSYANPGIEQMVAALHVWERNDPRPALYALKNEIAHQALRQTVPTTHGTAGLFFALKRLDVEVCRALALQLDNSDQSPVLEIPTSLVASREAQLARLA